MVQTNNRNIVATDGKDIFDRIGFKGSKRWRYAPPDVCPSCNDSAVQGVEIIGAYIGLLFWECEGCKEPYLRFTEKTTIKYLEKTMDLFIDLEDLDNICKQLPN